MRNRYQITCLVIDLVIDGESDRKMDVQYFVVLCHYTPTKSVIDNKADVLLSMAEDIPKTTKVIYKLEKYTVDFIDKDFRERHNDSYRTFYIFCPGSHLDIIPQNYIKSKHILPMSE